MEQFHNVKEHNETSMKWGKIIQQQFFPIFFFFFLYLKKNKFNQIKESGIYSAQTIIVYHRQKQPASEK
jgi:hypothetical protein